MEKFYSEDLQTAIAEGLNILTCYGPLTSRDVEEKWKFKTPLQEVLDFMTLSGILELEDGKYAIREFKKHEAFWEGCHEEFCRQVCVNAWKTVQSVMKLAAYLVKATSFNIVEPSLDTKARLWVLYQILPLIIKFTHEGVEVRMEGEHTEDEIFYKVIDWIRPC